MAAPTTTVAVGTEGALGRRPVRSLVVAPPRAVPGETAAAVRERMHGERHATVSHIVVCEGERFVALVRATDLIAADAATPVDALVVEQPPVVSADATRDEAIWAAVRAGEGEVVVVDEDGMLVGLVPAPRLLAASSREHEDDLARLSGVLHQGDTARRALDEPVLRRLWHRLPWLLVGLAGAILASIIMSRYEGDLREVVALSFFLPGIVYLSAAIGAQTTSIIVRGLSIGTRVRDVVWRELVTGVGLALALAVGFFPAAWVLADSSTVAFAVSLALLLACAVANVIGLGIPWLLDRLDTDPAFGAGPLGTVVQDLLTIVVYLAVARVVVF